MASLSSSVLLLSLLAILPCLAYSHGVAEKVDLSIAKVCPVRFDHVDFSSVTSVCKAPKYSRKACCEAFQKMACKYSNQVNDFSSTCPVEFMAYLNYAGNYPHGVFIDRCISSNILCSM